MVKVKIIQDFYTLAFVLINLQEEIGEKQLLYFSLIGRQKKLLMHIALSDALTFKILKLSADNICKQFGPRPGPTKCTKWIQSIWHWWYSWKIYFKKVILKKSLDDKKACKFPSRQRVELSRLTVLSESSESIDFMWVGIDCVLFCVSGEVSALHWHVPEGEC